VWVLTYPAKPWSVNEQVKWSWPQRRRAVAEWRDTFHVLALQARIPRLGGAWVVARTSVAGHRRYDVGNEFYAVKAAVDGIVSAGVLPDDTPRWVHGLTFLPAVTGAGRPGLTVAVWEHRP
jgi:crossover junction endodeoxyribonuclease RusA